MSVDAFLCYVKCHFRLLDLDIVVMASRELKSKPAFCGCSIWLQSQREYNPASLSSGFFDLVRLPEVVQLGQVSSGPHDGFWSGRRFRTGGTSPAEPDDRASSTSPFSRPQSGLECVHRGGRSIEIKPLRDDDDHHDHPGIAEALSPYFQGRSDVAFLAIQKAC